MPEPRRRSPRGQGAALRDEVLRAAMDLLRETSSEEAVSLRAVAERVGVSVPSIYLHFADKAALMDAVCGEVFAALHVAMKAASEEATDPFQALRAQGRAYVRFALANPEHYRIVMMRTAGDLDVADEMASGAFGYLLESVTACLVTGVLEGEAVDIGLRLWAAAHGIAALLIAKPTFPWPPVDEVVDAVITGAGLGAAVLARLPADLPVDDVRRRLDQLR